MAAPIPVTRIHCDVCGIFEISEEAAINARSSETPRENLYILSALARNAHEGGKCLRIMEADVDGLPRAFARPQPLEQQFLILDYVARHTTPGKSIRLKPKLEYAVAFADPESFQFLQNELLKEGLIERTDTGAALTYRILTKGHERLATMRAQGVKRPDPEADKLARRKRIVSLRDRVLRDFTAQDWESVAVLTDLGEAITGYPRLLQSLRWRDDDYPANVFGVLQEMDTRAPDSLGILKEYLDERYPSALTTVPPSAPVESAKMSDSAAETYDVALSFAGENRDYVERVAKLLRDAGVNVFYDDFEQAALWGEDLGDHLAVVYGSRSRFVVTFISEHYARKAWPTHERRNAQARAISERRAILLPARFDDTEIPGLPATIGYIDLKKTTPERLVELLLEKLKGK